MKRFLGALVTLIMFVGIINCVPVEVYAVSEKNIESISFTPAKPIELIENYDGCWKTGSYYDVDIDEEIEIEYFEYDVWEYIYQSENIITICYKDGTSKELSWSYSYRSYSNDDSIWCYGEFIDEDGNEIEIKFKFLRDINNQWEAGNEYTGTVSYMGVFSNVSVSVVENPVESINFTPAKPIELIENVDGNWTNEWIYDEETGEETKVEYFEYGIREIVNQPRNILTVNYKNGTSTDFLCDSPYSSDDYCDNNGNYISVGYGSDQSYLNQWIPGNEYEISVSYLGVETSVPVIVRELPVQSVEWAKMPDKTEYIHGEFIDLSGGVIRITAKDGSIQDIAINSPADFLYADCYIEAIDRSVILDGTERANFIGEQTQTIVLLGEKLEFEYNVIECDVTNITIQCDEQKNIDIILKNSDGTSTVLNFIDGDFGWGDGGDDYNVSGGRIITDKGIFNGAVYVYDSGELSLYLILKNVENFHSNRLSDTSWYEFSEVADFYTVVIGSVHGLTTSYNGKITEKNISDIARIALCNNKENQKGYFFNFGEYSSRFFDENKGFCYNGDAKTVEDAIYDTFGINIDLCDYSIYNKKTQTVTIDNVIIKQKIKFPITKKCIDGLWYITAESNGETIEIVVDENRNIKSFKIGEGCAHKSSDWFTDREATVYKAGSKHKECTECGGILKTVTIPQLKCAKPVLKKVYNANDYVKVTWGTVKGADIYRVYRMVSGGEYEYIGSTTNKYFNDKNAPAGKTCRYKIRAKNEAGYSDYSVSLAIKHIDEPNLIATENTSSGVKITWGNKVTGAQKYNVYRRVSGGEYKYIGSTSDTYYIDETVKSGTKYHYAIRGKRDDSVSSQSESLSKYYLDTPTLNKPSSTTKGIGIKWSQVEGAEGYMVYRRTTDDNYIIVSNEKGESNTAFRDTTTKKGRIYYYRVKAYKSKTYSGNSVTKSARDEH